MVGHHGTQNGATTSSSLFFSRSPTLCTSFPPFLSPCCPFSLVSLSHSILFSLSSFPLHLSLSYLSLSLSASLSRSLSLFSSRCRSSSQHGRESEVRGRGGFRFPAHGPPSSSVRALPPPHQSPRSRHWQNISLEAAQGGKD